MADTLRSGQVAMTGSAQSLSAAGIPKNVARVKFQPLAANTAPIYLGFDSTVLATTGFQMKAGEPYTFDLQNPGRLWVIGTAAERLSWATEGA